MPSADNAANLAQSSSPNISSADANDRSQCSRSSDLSPTQPPFPPSSIYLPAEDEGYASDCGVEEFEQAGGYSAIDIPPLSSRWSQDDDHADWVPEYLKDDVDEAMTDGNDEGLGMDVMDLCRCECDIVGDC